MNVVAAGSLRLPSLRASIALLAVALAITACRKDDPGPPPEPKVDAHSGAAG